MAPTSTQVFHLMHFPASSIALKDKVTEENNAFFHALVIEDFIGNKLYNVSFQWNISRVIS